MVRLGALFVSALSVCGSALAESVLDLTPKNFDQIVHSDKPAFVEFFAPWCGHCKNLAPTWEELAGSFAHAKDKVTIAKVDADQHKDLAKKYGISGFPTLKFFDGSKDDNPEPYKGGRDLDALSSYVTDKVKGLKAKLKKAAPSSVEMLTDKTFAEKVGSDQDVFVAFTAPWCGHCKSLAPTWESLAADFAAEAGIVVAKVDAEAENAKATAKEQGVTSYPTIKFFPRGSKEGQEYSGGRGEEQLVNFLNGKIGTHRLVGGGLDAKAGTIEALDAVVSKLSGSDLATITKEAKKAAKGLQDKYAEYYLKVLAKMEATQGYAAKELKRLEGILGKGGLAQEKVDDVTSRSNILRVFTGSAEEKADTKDEL